MDITSSPLIVRDIPLSEIVAGDNDRERFDPKELAALGESIRHNGLAQPITVRPLLFGYEIVAGERRFRAHQLIGATTIPAIVRELDDSRAAAIMLTENTGRVDLSPIEEARAYRARMVTFGNTAEEVATMAGVSKAQVGWRIDLLALRPEIQQLVHVGQITPGFAWELARVDHDRQIVALKVAQSGASFDEVRSCVDRLLDAQAQDSIFDADTFLSTEEYVIGSASRPRKATRKQLVALLEQAAAGVTAELAAQIAAALAAE